MAGILNIIHHSLNAGEVSPRFAARQDQNKYLAACETMQNFRPLVLGGATFCEGTQFVTETKTVEDHQEKIIRPFVAARTAAYTMEFGHLYVRFFKDGAPVMDGLNPLELVTPYTDTDLAELFLVQSIDVCYLLHGSYPTQKISRTAVDVFTITPVNFDPPATLEEEPTGEDLGGGTLTPGATSGDGVTFTAQSAAFLAADVGRIIVHGGSRAVIVTVTDSTHVDADIIDDFPDTNPIPADEWWLRLSPQTTLDIEDNKKEVGDIATLTAGAAAFRSADLGKWITLFGGLVRIDQVNSSTQVRGTIKIRLSDIEEANPDATRAWTLEVAAWSTELGFPNCGCFFQERLWLCKGLTINGSVTNDFENFGKGGNDDDAIARTVSDDDVDAIVWIKGDQELRVGTGSGIYEAGPTTQNGALTPTSFQIKPIDPNGAAKIPPLRVSPVLIYVDASRRELRELSYNFADDNFKSPRLFRLADHLMDGFFLNEICAVASPDNIIYAVRSDGVLLGLVYEQVEQVIGWYRIVTDGEIKSACVIPRPSTGKDWLWIIVERDNGIFVEHFEPDHNAAGRQWPELLTHSAVVAEPASFVVSGLDHLEGQTVWVIGDGMLFNFLEVDGVIQSTAVVLGGQVTLDPQIEVSKVEVGLAQTGVLVPVEPQLPAEAGGPMIARSYVEVGVRIRRTLGLTLRAYRVGMTEPGDDELIGERLVYRKAYHPLDQHVPLQRGKKCIQSLGNDPFARIEIKQTLPFPAEILNVIGKLHVGDRWDCESYDEVIVTAQIEPEPEPVPTNCPADTVPEPQELNWNACYTYNDGIPSGSLSTNNRGQFNPIPAPHPSVNAIATVGQATGFHGAYPRSTIWQVLRITDSGIEAVTPVPLPPGDVFTHSIQAGQAGSSGHTDALGYLLTGTYTPSGGGALGATYCWFDWEAQTVYQMRSAGLPDVLGKWAKRGTDFYRFANDDLYYWNMNAATFSNPVASLVNSGIFWIDIFRTATKLWAIDNLGTLYELNPASLATIATHATGMTDNLIGLHAASDTLFYILSQGANIAETRISIFELPGGTLTQIDQFHGGGCASSNINGGTPNDHQFHFAGGYFYVNRAGTTGNTSAGRIGPLFCPGSMELIIGGDGD